MLQTTFLPNSPGRYSCDRCGRRLRDPVSRAIGTGPVCRRYVTTRREEILLIIEPAPAIDVPEIHASPTFFTWYDPDRKRSEIDKLGDAVTRYRERHGDDPRVVIAHPSEAGQLVGETWLEVRAGAFVGVSTFYLAVDAGGVGTRVEGEDEG